MTVASIGNYVAASYNNPYMSQSLGSDFGGSIFGVTEDGKSRFLQYRQASSGQIGTNTRNAAANYSAAFQDIQAKLIDGCTTDAIQSFDEVVQQILNNNSYYNMTEEQARSIANQAYAQATGSSLANDINTYVDSAYQRSDKASSWFNFGDDNIQWDLTAEEAESLMIHGEEYDKAKLDAEAKRAKRDNNTNKFMGTAITATGIAIAGALTHGSIFGAIGACLTNPIGWGALAIGAIVLGCRLYQNAQNKKDAELAAKQARANA